MANLIEQNVRISKSKLWDLQSQFYKTHGIKFWRERASFTSANTVVVSACVDLLIGYLQDQQAYFDRQEPIYFVELGTGSGCFAYRFLKEFLLRISSINEIADLNVRYVMTDFIPEIVPIWKSNPFLKRLVDRESLDFALFDPSCDQSITTSCFNWSVNSSGLINAPIFIANALFDTIGIDGFRFSNQSLSEILISTESDSDDPISSLVNNTLVIHQKSGQVVQSPYYEKKHFNALLSEYSTNLQQGALSIPIKTMEILDNLRNLSKKRMSLLCCSRGFTDLRYAESAGELQYHDLSFPLNFDALQKYFAITGGELFLPEAAVDKFISRCLSFGFYLPEAEKADLDQTRRQYPISSNQLARVTESIQQKLSDGTDSSACGSKIDSVIDIVTVGKYDPPLFLRCIAQSMDAIESELSTASELQRAVLLEMLRKVDSNIYTFDKTIPKSLDEQSPDEQSPDENDVFASLIRVWQRASAAHHQSGGRTIFGVDE